MMKYTLIIYTLLFISSPLLAAMSEKSIDSSDGKRKNLVEIFKKSGVNIKNPFGMRDPFKRKLRKDMRKTKIGGRMLENGKFTNLPTIESVDLDQVRVVGVVLGESRRAIAKLVDGDGRPISRETYIIREGMKLGVNKAEVRAIVPGGLVLVEKIRNVYDQDEYIETVIPITILPKGQL